MEKKVTKKDAAKQYRENNNRVVEEAVDGFVVLKDVNKVYDNRVQAVFDFNLSVAQNEFIVLVGPSGCGKSTTLRMIAGLEEITSGYLYIDRILSNYLESKDRDIAMVFQSYALYPNMSVFDNIGFGLKVRGVPKDEIKKRVFDAAEILDLGPYLDRKPRELSGGQMQRVALGRAIVREAKVFLMDEPLSNLDAKLRVSMRSEIIKLHKAINATTIYVTHDQTEAMTMASRIVVMKSGYVQQIGTPEEVYNNPANMFVATFIGAPAMNLLDCTYDGGALIFGGGLEIKLDKNQVAAHDEFYRAQIAATEKRIADKEYEKPDMNVLLTHHREKPSFKALINKLRGKTEHVKIKTPEDRLAELNKLVEDYKACLNGTHALVFGIRPEDVYENADLPKTVKPSAAQSSEISVAELLGSEYHVHFNMCGKDVIAKCKVARRIEDGAQFEFVFDLNKMHLFDKINTKSIF